MNEIFLPVKGYEGYQIGDQGTVLSDLTGRPMRHQDNGLGYMYVQLWHKGSRRTHYIDRLVAQHFGTLLGPQLPCTPKPTYKRSQVPQAPLSHQKVNYTLAIVGAVGAGKSTLSEALSRNMEKPLICEPLEKNEYIENLPDNFFSCQFKMLRLMEASHRDLKASKNGIMDRTAWETYEVFSRQFSHLMTPEERLALRTQYKTIERSLYIPEVVIFLEAPPYTCESRCKKRGRNFEKKYDRKYFEDQVFLYGGLVSHLEKLTTVITLDANMSAESVYTDALRRLGAYERALPVH